MESQILIDFKLSKCIVSTDAALELDINRKFNNRENVGFIRAQSIKKLNKTLKEWTLAPTGWRLPGNSKQYDIRELDREIYRDKVFYKERWIKENDIGQRLIVTYSLKYKEYHRNVRNNQIQRILKIIDNNPQKLDKSDSNVQRRFIKKVNYTKNGEEAKKAFLSIDLDVVSKEEIYDGFYSVSTNLDSDVADIIKSNHRRWHVEDYFRIMKSEFKSKPVYPNNSKRINAHFITTFISLLICRLLERELGGKYSIPEIINSLSSMDFMKSKDGFIPIYTRSDFTDDLHEAFGFRTDYEIISTKEMKRIFKSIQK